MRRTNTLLLLFLTACCYGQTSSGGDKAGLKNLPFLIQWDDAGLKIRAIKDKKNYLQVFDLRASNCLEDLGQDFVNIKPGCASISIDFNDYIPKEKASMRAVEEDLVPKGASTGRIKIEKTNSLFQRDLGKRDHILVLEGYGRLKGQQQKFIISGIDVFKVEADPDAVFKVQGDQVRVDLANCNTNLLLTKGGIINEAGFIHKLAPLGQKYNKKYVEYDGFIYEGKSSVGGKWDFEHVRRLMTKYSITDFEDRPLVYLSDLLITKKGIGMRVLNSNVKQDQLRVGYQYFDWSEFVNLRFQRQGSNAQVKIRSPYGEETIYNGNRFFSNVEMIQFFNELRSVILQHLDMKEIIGDPIGRP